jgi:gliding motility-associated-like protein
MLRSLIKIAIFVQLAFIFNINLANAQLSASFTADKIQGCKPLVVRFLNTSTGGPDSCSWDFGNGNRSKLCGPVTATYNDPGTYNVVLTIFKGGAQSTSTRVIRVFRDPIANFDATIKGGCVPLSTSFINSSIPTDAPIQSYTWDFADGRVSSAASPSHTYLGEGGFSVTLIVTDQNGCRSSVTKDSIVVATDRPVADFVVDRRSACAIPFTANFADSSNTRYPVTYQWDFGRGVTSTLKNPTNIYSDTGSFNVKLTITNKFGCSDDTTKTQIIRVEKVVAKIVTSDTLGCTPYKSNFKAQLNVPFKSFFWDLGNGITSTDTSVSTTYSTSGTYTVKLIGISQQGCIDTVTKIIRVGEKPDASFTVSKNQACGIPFTTQYTNTSSSNAVEFLWDFGDGTISTSEDPSKTYNRLGYYYTRLYVKTIEGCTDTSFIRDFIFIGEPVLEMTAIPDGGCSPLNSRFNVSLSGPGTIQNINWNFGNGNTFSGINPPIQTYNSIGSFNNTATVTFSDGCATKVLSKTVGVGTKPNVSGSITPKLVCAETQSVKYTAVGGDFNTKFTWYFGDGKSSDGKIVSYEYSDIGTFDVWLVVSNSGCKDSVFIDKVVVQPPIALFTSSVVCFSKTVTFNNTSIGADSSYWEFGDGTFLNNPPRTSLVSHTFPANGSYDVRLKVFNKATGCMDTVTNTVDLKLRRPFFIINPQIGCAPLTVSFEDTNTFNRTTRWDFGDTIIQGKKINYIYDTSGLYNINIYVQDVNGCRDTFRFPKIINAVKYDAGFSFNPIGGCAPVNVTFEDTTKLPYSTIVDWKWDIGGLATSTLKKHNYTFAATDTFDIQLITTDNLGCKDTVVNQVITAFPQANFTSDFFSVCTDVNFQFTNTSKGIGLNYFWDFGNGQTSNDTAPSVIYNTEGQYSIKLLVIDDNNCRDSIIKTNFLKVENFVYDFDAGPRFKTCPELVTNFQISPANILYREAFWDFGNGNQSRDTSRFPTNIYNAAGTFDVTLELIDFRGCKEKIFKPDFIEVRGPSGSYTIEPDSGCIPLVVVFKSTTQGSALNFWDFGDGSGLVDDQILSEVSHTYINAGLVKTSLILDDNLGCIVNIVGPEIRISSLEAEAAVSSSILCKDEAVLFTDASVIQSFSPNVSWNWDFGDGNTATGDSVTHKYFTDSNKVYTVKFFITNTFGCSDSGTVQIEAFSDPPLTVDGDKIICKGTDVQLNASGVKYFEWSPKESLINPNTANPIARPVNSTSYIVMGYDTITCPTYDTVNVSVINRVTADAGPDTSICLGESVQLFVLSDSIASSAIKYTWQPATNLSNPNIANPIATPTTDATYLVTVEANDCEKTTIPVFIKVGNYPDINAGEDKTIFKGTSVVLDVASSAPVTYTWSPVATLSCSNCQFPSASPLTTTTYLVAATNQDGCAALDSLVVRVFETCDGEQIFVPNTFTPNSDGNNDIFIPQGIGVEKIEVMRIYDRWGELLFETLDIRNGWDGTFNGKTAQPGVYVYYIEAFCLNGEKSFKKGNVTLLR